MTTDLVSWIRRFAPGVEQEGDGELRILHVKEGVSSLWYRKPEEQVPEALRRLAGLYDSFDGADLFSSTFKIASLAVPRRRGSVAIVPSVDALVTMARTDGATFPEGCVPFMYQAGIGYYAVSQIGSVLEWDTETREFSGEYDDVLSIFQEWLQAAGHII